MHGSWQKSLYFRVFGLGLLEDGDVGVGVFPECEEVLIRGFCFGGIALHGVSASQLQPGWRAPAICHCRRSQYSRNSRSCISGDCPLPTVETRA